MRGSGGAAAALAAWDILPAMIFLREGDRSAGVRRHRESYLPGESWVRDAGQAQGRGGEDDGEPVCDPK
jgi:hypothetical protein